MASGRLFIPGWMPARDSNGDPIPNVVVSFYQNETDVLASVYADEALTVPLTNPVAANSSGRFPQIYASDAMTYSASVDAPYGPAGQPFTFDGLQASQAADIAAANLAQGAAEDAEAALAATEAAIDAATQVGGGAAALAGALAGATAGTAAANVVVATKLDKGQNLADLNSIATARANIGLGVYKRPEDFDPTAGSGGDDTAAIQAAIDAAKGSGASGRASASVLLSAKDYRVTGLTINRPLDMFGVGSKASRIILVESATAPAVKINCAFDTTNYWISGGTPAEVRLGGFTIVGPNRDAAAGQNVAHGVSLENAAVNPIYTRVVLDDLFINGVPGDGLSATGWQGLLEWRSAYIAYVGRYSVYANSVTDWRFISGDIFGAKKDNFLFSGAVAMQLVGVNCYVALENNMNIFGASSVVAQGCYFDLAAQHNIRANMDHPSADLRMSDCTVRWASQQTDNVYSDLYIDPSPRGGRVQLSNVKFENPLVNGFSAKGPKYNIEFATTAIALTRIPGVIFIADDDTDPTRGPLARARISNDMRRVRMFRGEIPAATTAQLRSASDLVNTTNKRPGAQVFEIDNNRYLSAINGTVTGGWYLNGTLAINVDLP